MYFPYSFTRYVGTVPAGGTALGADVAPTTTPPANNDNLITHFTANVNGWPAHRLVGVLQYIGGNNPVDVPVQLYLWVDNLGQWFKYGSSITMHSNGQAAYFASLAALEYVGPSQTFEYPRPGSAEFLAIPTNSGAVNGQYNFSFCPDITIPII